MYVIYSKSGQTLKGKLWNGTVFESEETISLYPAGKAFSVITIGDIIHLVYTYGSTIRHVIRTTSWQESIIVTSSPSYPILTKLDNSNLCLFWRENNTIFFKKYIDGSWGATKWWFSDSFNSYQAADGSVYTASYEAEFGTLIGFTWARPSPYPVVFQRLELPETFIMKKALYRIKIELLGLNDIYGRMKSIHRVITELLGGLDVKSRIKSIHRVVTELLGLNDIYGRMKSIHRSIAESLGLKDTYTRKKSLHRIASETIGLVDTQTHQVHIFIIGITRDSTGNPLGNCEVWLFRTGDKEFIDATVSDDDGNYAFEVPYKITEYFVLAYLDDTPTRQGITERTIRGGQ